MDKFHVLKVSIETRDQEKIVATIYFSRCPCKVRPVEDISSDSTRVGWRTSSPEEVSTDTSPQLKELVTRQLQLGSKTFLGVGAMAVASGGWI